MLDFVNDYSEGAHEKILQRLLETNMEKLSGYGTDQYCESAKQKIREVCECPEADIYFLVGGTQTNATVIDAILSQYEGVVAANTGRPSKCNRTILNGIVWIARSGAPWRDLPERYGPWQTVYSRFRKWMEDGILDNIFRVLSLDAELSELSIDASIVQAHQHSAGAKKGGHPTKSDTVAVEQVQKSMPL